MAVMGFYAALLLLANIPSSKKKTVAPVKVDDHHHAATSGNEMPPIDSPDFSKWLETPGNIEKALA
jgi:hypothetical protein